MAADTREYWHLFGEVQRHITMLEHVRDDLLNIENGLDRINRGKGELAEEVHTLMLGLTVAIKAYQMRGVG